MNKRHIIICRCEGVTYGEITASITEGALTSQEIKMDTRAGMGMCQGKVCCHLIARMLPTHKEGLCKTPTYMTIHHPIRPVPLSQIRT